MLVARKDDRREEKDSLRLVTSSEYTLLTTAQQQQKELPANAQSFPQSTDWTTADTLIPWGSRRKGNSSKSKGMVGRNCHAINSHLVAQGNQSRKAEAHKLMLISH